MKFNKKKVLVIALAVCLVAIISAGSLAWFTDTETVVNNFMVTDSESDADDLFSVDLYETKVGTDGQPVVPAETTKANVYEDLAPKDVLVKDPTVQNTGLYDQWIRLRVTLTDAADWMTVLNRHHITDITTIFGGYDGAIWQSEGNDNPVVDANGAVTFDYYLKAKLTPGATATLFETVNIPEVFTQEDLALVNEFNITIVAQAIQADNTKDTAKATFDAYWQ